MKPIDKITKNKHSGWIEEGICNPIIGCGQLITEPFKDELSEKEYAITGMCQECQDEFFMELVD